MQHRVERVNYRHMCVPYFHFRSGTSFFSWGQFVFKVLRNQNFSVRPYYCHSMWKIYFQNFISRYSTLNTNFKNNRPRLPTHRRSTSEMHGLISCKHHNGFVETTPCRGTKTDIPHGECIADSRSAQNGIIFNNTTNTMYVSNKAQRTFHFMSLFPTQP